MDWFKSIWEKLISPHPKIIDEEERINSRLLSTLMVIMLPMGGIFLAVIPFIIQGKFFVNIDLIIFGSMLIALSGAYWINRKGHLLIAYITILIVGGFFILLEATLDVDETDLVFLILPMLLSSIYLPRKYIYLLSILFISGIVFSAFTFPQTEARHIVKFVLPFIVTGSALILITSSHRDNIEHIRKERIRASELRYTLVTEAVNDGLWDWDFKTNTVYYSPRWKAMIGYEPDELSDSPEEWRTRIHPEDLERVSLELGLFRNFRPVSFKVDYRFRHRDGRYIWVMSRGIPIYDENNLLTRTVGSHTDITDRKHAEQELEHNALHDSLTGLANRFLFNEKVEHSIKFAKKNPSYRFAVLFLDMDNFKDVNDSMGHDSGDEFLKQFASRLETNLFDLDTVARLGGDEFVILLEGLDDVQRPIDIARRLKRIIKKPFLINDSELLMTVSIGIVIGTSAYKTAEEVLRDADIAMYHAKNSGKDTFEIFDPVMREQILKRLNLERELRLALQNDEFRLAYQPITNLYSNQLIGFEALIRWQHPERGLVSPNDFIPIAEKTGLIIPIGDWVLQTACTQLSEWDKIFSPSRLLKINVNVSEKQISNPQFLASICQILEQTGITPSRLNLEITENAILQNNPEILTVLTSLDKMGINLHLDDFGTGQSSLGYLRRFPLKTIKIDRTFINNLHKPQDRNLIHGIIQLTKALKLRVIAEGIETKEQAATLRSLQCNRGQGFGISKPKFAHEIEILLSEHVNGSKIILPITDFQA